MLPLMFLVLLAPAAEQSSYVTWTVKTDQPAKPGQATSEAEAIARSLGNFIALELDKKFPCGGATTLSDSESMAGFERLRDLLGANPSTETLAGIAGEVGARNIINLTVVQTGSNVTVDAVVVDSAAKKETAKKSSSFVVGPSTVDELEAFATSLVGGLGGTIPRCNGNDWAGVVRVSYQAKGSNEKTSEEGSGLMVCRLFGDEGKARCTYSSTYLMKGSGGSISVSKSAKNAEVSASASVTGSRLSISIGAVPVTTTFKGPTGVNPPPYEETLAGEQFDLPATSSLTTQSGEHSPESLGNMKVTISWSLSKRVRGAR